MTIACTVEPFAADGDPAVRGTLHRPDRHTGDVIVLTHGAGSSAAATLLVTLADAFVAAGIAALRCDLPFRQRRPSGPPSRQDAARDRRGLSAALLAMRGVGRGRRFVGGHSYGGRQASMLLAEAPALAEGLLLLSYPLHPPSRPEGRRVDHLPALRCPTLFVHGTRDPFGTPAELEAARALVPAATDMIVVPGAAHALRPDAELAATVVTAFLRLLD